MYSVEWQNCPFIVHVKSCLALFTPEEALFTPAFSGVRRDSSSVSRRAGVVLSHHLHWGDSYSPTVLALHIPAWLSIMRIFILLLSLCVVQSDSLFLKQATGLSLMSKDGSPGSQVKVLYFPIMLFQIHLLYMLSQRHFCMCKNVLEHIPKECALPKKMVYTMNNSCSLIPPLTPSKTKLKLSPISNLR